jgi:hypothetical protein
MLLTVVCAHSDGRLVAHHRHAVLWIRPLSVAGQRVYTRRELLITAGTMLAPMATLVLALALGIDEQTSTPARVAALAIAAVLVGGPLLGIVAVSRWRDLTTRISPQLQRLAARTPTPPLPRVARH